eukprot:CAMPEP_0113534954 /NCGR_PEP_ID=MMETSP0015_2-20120614/5432_1 /TAXON_ID=2838 /ORGANISM="Odontella" /LENGTH=490 /DNA_ID=CAMNT_0000434145 /DNA_START=151 /DNA_END=1623 /DNA_ORIENTATION=+ /assembly_acc=CAM_ASM_000160
MRAVTLGSGKSLRCSLLVRNNLLGHSSLALDSLRDGEKRESECPGSPDHFGNATRAFSSVVINNASNLKISTTSHYFDDQRRTLFGWGKGKGKNVEDTSESVTSASGTSASGTSGGDENFGPGAAQSSDADQTVFSTGSDETAAQALSAVESSPSFAPSFGSSPIKPEDEVLKAAADVAGVAEKLEGLDWSQDFCWYYPQDHVVDLVNYVHMTTGWSYAVVVAALTCGIRLAAFPLFVKAQQNSSRMAHMKPEMDLLKARVEALGSQGDSNAQMQMGLEMRALFKKYDCNPLKALIVPLVQMPVFMSMFLGLRKMPDYFPNELSTGGAFWFPDLSAADPTWVMPIASGLMFVGMVELGKEQMLANNREQGELFLNVFRVMGVVVTAATINFPALIFCYWMPNNSLSVVQAIVFKNDTLRRNLGIWDLPHPVPGQEPKGIVETLQGAIKPSKTQTEEERINAHNERIDRRNTGRRKAVAGRKGRKGRRNKS